MRKVRRALLVVAPLVAVGVLVAWQLTQRSAPPEVPFSKVRRETLVSTVVTNGKVEPLEWVAVRALRSGMVEKVHVRHGQRVARGQVLAELDSTGARMELAAAEGRREQTQAALALLERGGPALERARLEGEWKQAQLELETAQREHDELARLALKQAATRLEVAAALRRLNEARLRVESLERQRAALADPADRQAAEGRLREAEAAVRLAQLRVEQGFLRAPAAGVVYDIEVRPGAYLNAGDSVAKVGQIEKVRIRLYVDEPELGRVARGMPVTITWDALPGRRWKGTVEQTPTQVVTLGTRQVGEVICMLDNPGGELLPGTNINAEILSQSAENALTVPKEALRTSGGQTGVFVLNNDGKVAWRPVRLGVASVTRAQVLAGLREGEAVALPLGRQLRDGDAVRPVFP
ncbi:MAG: efflux RND transporter periplasmic adaptor subunit [Bryobacterales bacterium]|nr:efflux RND transporter periplasmic adaptor subunit [Bryobacteraceae bacterium]MDW8352943.1 efflux RND transporter periplasmic adaptor subunit [Bryobacterales bacterium]